MLYFNFQLINKLKYNIIIYKMSAYEPPVADYPIFDSLAFQTPNSASLTLAEGDIRYLARQNIATSIASLTSFAGSIETPLINTASTINFTSSILDSNIDIGNGNLTNLFPTKNNIAIGSDVMSGAGLLAGAINNTGIGGSILTGLTSGDRNVAIGHNIATGITTGSDNVILGTSVGGGNGSSNVLIGNTVGANLAGGNQNVLIGNNANVTTAFATTAVAIGANAIANSSSVSIGVSAGGFLQGASNVAIGNQAGVTSQGNTSVAVGNLAGNYQQGAGCVAIGNGAGQGTTSGQGANSVAIGNGAGNGSQVAGSIVLNAAGGTLNPTNVSTYINPIRSVGGSAPATIEVMFYNTSTKELISGTPTIVKNSSTNAQASITSITYYTVLTTASIPVGYYMVTLYLQALTTAVAGSINNWSAGLSTTVGSYVGGTGAYQILGATSTPAIAGNISGTISFLWNNTTAQTYLYIFSLVFSGPTISQAANSGGFIQYTRIA
jgi:hypothetical protein